MNTKKKLFLSIGLFLMTIPLFTLGQERLTGLYQNPLLQKSLQLQSSASKNITPAKLPFIEDFSKGIGYPNEALWMDRQAFVNNSYPIYPPSIGVATLDALDAAGKMYAHANREGFSADTLTSVPIRLDSNFTHHRAMQLGDSLYFSFFYQPGGGCTSTPALAWERVGDAPESNDELVLEFGYATGNLIFTGYLYGEYHLGEDENYISGDTIFNPFLPNCPYIVEENLFAGEVILIPVDSLFGPEYVWNQVWSSNGCTLDSWLSENPLQYFKQVLIPIRDAQYLRNNFQFRFRNYASLDLDAWNDNNIIGWASNCDQWHIDYIRLNTDRSYNDFYPNDVAFVAPTTTALKQYQSMPWSQYRSTDMASQFQNQLANISGTPKNTFYNYKVNKADGSNVYVSTLNSENAAPFHTQGLHSYPYHANPAIDFAYTYDNSDSASFTITHVFRMEGANDEEKRNDTCTFQQKFYNYYAYDDGTAESGYCLLSSSGNPSSSLAVQFTLAKPDTLRCIRMWFNHVLNDDNIENFSLMVWNDNDGTPGEVIYTMDAQLPYHEDDFYDFANYYLDEPVAIEGTFYVGFQQNHNVQLNLGFDQNNDARGHFFYKTTNEWRESFYKGAPMIRPVVGKAFDHSGMANRPMAHNIKIYPNPTTSDVVIQAEQETEGFQYQLFDIYGRLIQLDHIQSRRIQMQHLQSGVYLLKIYNGNQPIHTEKIIKQ